MRRRRIQKVARGRGGREATSASGNDVFTIRALKGAREILRASFRARTLELASVPDVARLATFSVAAHAAVKRVFKQLLRMFRVASAQS
ncbi:MAG TPA: hypothetical protein VGC66_22875 [Pyrinomonadaceae bacterium]